MQKKKSDSGKTCDRYDRWSVVVSSRYGDRCFTAVKTGMAPKHENGMSTFYAIHQGLTHLIGSNNKKNQLLKPEIRAESATIDSTTQRSLVSAPTSLQLSSTVAAAALSYWHDQVGFTVRLSFLALDDQGLGH